MNDSNLIHHLQGNTTGRLFIGPKNGTYYTPGSLLEKGVAICTCCGKMQPRERINCVSCGEIHFFTRDPQEDHELEVYEKSKTEPQPPRKRGRPRIKKEIWNNKI